MIYSKLKLMYLCPKVQNVSNNSHTINYMHTLNLVVNVDSANTRRAKLSNFLENTVCPECSATGMGQFPICKTEMGFVEDFRYSMYN